MSKRKRVNYLTPNEVASQSHKRPRPMNPNVSFSEPSDNMGGPPVNAQQLNYRLGQVHNPRLPQEILDNIALQGGENAYNYASQFRSQPSVKTKARSLGHDHLTKDYREMMNSRDEMENYKNLIQNDGSLNNDDLVGGYEEAEGNFTSIQEEHPGMEQWAISGGKEWPEETEGVSFLEKFM